MIYKVETDLREKLAPMFTHIESTILLSYLQGHMGTAWVDDLHTPTVAQITVGIFVFYAGNTDTEEAKELLHNLPDFTLVIVGSEEWKILIEEVHKGSNEKFQRYTFIKDEKHLNRADLKKHIEALPAEFELKKVDTTIANDSSFNALSEDFISQFDSVQDFVDRGIGFALYKDEKAVCGATSFSIYNEGIEIEIVTHPDYLRKGLATITAAALMLHCLERNLYPSWDGANMESVRLAQKLGYVLKKSYDTYFIESKF